MYKVNLLKQNGTKVVAYKNKCNNIDSAAYMVVENARKIADKPEGGSLVIASKKYLRVVEAEDLKDFRLIAMPGKTEYIVLLLDYKADAFEEITVKAGSTNSAYAMALKQSVIKDNVIAYVYDTTQKPHRRKVQKEISLTPELRERIETFIGRCDYYRNCYFWTPSTSASTRSYLDDTYSIPDYYFAVNGDYYNISFEVDNQSRYVRAISYIKKNGSWTTLKTLKTLLRKDTNQETPQLQAS